MSEYLVESLAHACRLAYFISESNHFLRDTQGLELHRLKQHVDPLVLDFLPYHFLLVSAGRYILLHLTLTHKLSSSLGI